MSGSSASMQVADYKVSDLVALALRQIGVGASGTAPAAADLSDGLMHLNMQLAQWQRRRWMVPTLTDVSCASTGLGTYSVGPRAQLAIGTRPERIEAAYARLLMNGAQGTVSGDFSSLDFDPSDFLVGNDEGLDQATLTYDFPLALLESREDYAAIGVKNLRTWPALAYYAPTYPTGTLYVWPIPAAGTWEIHILAPQALPSGLKATDTINLPPEYADAIMWTLAARLAPSYGQEVSQTVAAFARAAQNTIRNANGQVPSLSLPGCLQSRWWGGAVGGLYGGALSGGDSSAGGGAVNYANLPQSDPGSTGSLYLNGGVVMVSGKGVLMSDGSAN
jgi:hypothetical protein